MRVAILHFHLRAGGVTRVIELACKALTSQGCDVLVISGEPMPAGCRLPAHQVRVTPSLQYGIEASQAEVLRAEIEAAMQAHWGATADVVHAHNHALGKNFALPLVITQWAKEGRALLLQVHDFPENGRPVNYTKLLDQLGGEAGLDRCLYPVGEHISYAVLNQVDRGQLLTAGLPECHMLPNPASLPAGGEPISRADLRAERAVVYPTRAIRRKNVGEALLWAIGAGEGERIVITGAPESGPDVARHAEWQSFAESLGLPVLFDAQRALGRPSEDFLLSADLCLTTSVGEGFGMAFLEPWLADCAVAGRNLDFVTNDFRACGVRLDELYDRIDLPLEGPGELAANIEAQVRAACAAYRVAFEKRFMEQGFASVVRDGQVDFGRVTEERQREMLKSLVASGQKPRLPFSEKHIAENRKVIEHEYSLERYGTRLVELYGGGAGAKATTIDHLESRQVLLACLSFEDFFALRG